MQLWIHRMHIRVSWDQRLFGSFPRLFAAFRALHRLSAPRHPPHALSSLTAFNIVTDTRQGIAEKAGFDGGRIFHQQPELVGDDAAQAAVVECKKLPERLNFQIGQRVAGGRNRRAGQLGAVQFGRYERPEHALVDASDGAVSEFFVQHTAAEFIRPQVIAVAGAFGCREIVAFRGVQLQVPVVVLVFMDGTEEPLRIAVAADEERGMVFDLDDLPPLGFVFRV